MIARCPHTGKQCHTNKGAALAAIRSLNHAGKGSPDMSPYRCDCGAWHIGHDSRLFRKRIKNALAAGRRNTTRRKR